MNETEYKVKETEIFDSYNIPQELRGPLSYLAYQQGHAFGYYEVYNMLLDILDAIGKPLQQIAKQLMAAKQLKQASQQFINDFIEYTNSDDYDLPDFSLAQHTINKINELGI